MSFSEAAKSTVLEDDIFANISAKSHVDDQVK